MGSDHGSLKDEELMAECEVLEGDGRRPKEPGAQEGPETDHDKHRGPPASGMALSRDSTGSARDVVREVQPVLLAIRITEREGL